MQIKSIDYCPENIYPQMDLPRWIRSKENAVITLNDL